ncbi:MAG: YidB family protein [Pyrinomonadaceae bacterium]|nr:YidB family protein [Pyrinomonadaceae bacterium]
MSLFDSIINGASEKFGIGNKAGTVLSALLSLITDQNRGGFAGFLDLFSKAGLGDVASSWINSGVNEELTDEQVESALGEDTIADIAKQADISKSKAASTLAYMIPNVVDKLTPDGVIPEEKDLLTQIGEFLSGIGGAVAGAALAGAGAVGAVASGAADKVGDVANAAVDTVGDAAGATVDAGKKVVGAVGDTIGGAFNSVGGALDGDGDGNNDGILKWLLPLILLVLAIILGYWFCGKGTPVTPPPANTNANKASNTTATAKAVESSFSLTAKDGKYLASGVVADQKTLDEIKAKLDAQFGAGNVDYSGLKVDANAKPFAAGWWDSFQKLLPSLKDWKTGTLAFVGSTITTATGLPQAALDQIKSLFGTGWTLAADTLRTLGKVSLPTGAELDAYPGGIEDQLVKFIQSDEYKNATPESLKEKWFNFDDLTFIFGKTELDPKSKRQLDNITAILKAFPDVKIKIGGYTDKKGDEAANLKLSDGRAKAVKAALEKAGVGAQVPEAEGYGEKFATVDENASDDERAVDRKTSVRLIKGDAGGKVSDASNKPAANTANTAKPATANTAKPAANTANANK